MSTTTTGGRKPGQALNQVWTIEAVRELGVTTDVETAGAILGIGRTKAYELAKTNKFPVRLLRVGRRYLVPVPAILKLLAIE
ncbi:helix-turn-helix domain-containing protein [Micromonospora sp. NBC_01740]|uniref:helix-turn-helix domain-containing protein n=1 Tax=Micromonospora sp. NBC_01740 TaxID=2975986 RepID=UPI000C7022F7|nr:helix-turn-helix domain-containing protein [Micromonospora sp. NBC_01740]WSF99760.1 helix-turn-helix domain-containing protein [Micromonospora sp. NBC_01740]